MKTKRAYKYRFYPTSEQKQQLAQTFGCVRFVYNWGLSRRRTAYKERGEKLYYNDLAAMLPALKQEYPWLAEVSSVPLQQSLRHLDTAYKAHWYGRTLVKIDRFYPSSKTCSACGHVLESLTLDVREWICPDCGVCHDRDLNAAKNILAAGLAVNACGGSVRPVRAKARQAVPGEAGNALS